MQRNRLPLNRQLYAQMSWNIWQTKKAVSQTCFAFFDKIRVTMVRAHASLDVVENFTHQNASHLSECERIELTTKIGAPS